MKRFFSVFLSAVMLCIVFAGCSSTQTPSAESTATSIEIEDSKAVDTTLPQEDIMYIIVGEHTLTVKLADNSSAAALQELLKRAILPLTLMITVILKRLARSEHNCRQTMNGLLLNPAT